MDGNVSRYIPPLQELPQLTRVVAGVSRQRHRLERQSFQQLRNRLPFSYGGMGDPPGQDKTAPVCDDILLVIQTRGLAGSGGTPTGVGIDLAQWQAALRILEVPDLLMTNTIFVYGRIG